MITNRTKADCAKREGATMDAKTRDAGQGAATMTKQSCRTCAHLEVPLDKAGRRIPRAGRNYLCRAPMPDLKAILPEGCWLRVARLPFTSTGMFLDEGTTCPTYQPVGGKEKP